MNASKIGIPLPPVPTTMLRILLLPAILATAAHAWQPAPDSMLTEWGGKVTPDNAWREYPRPALAREQWTSLNGLWKYAVTPKSADTAPSTWIGEILVPFAIESALSGVKKRLTPEEAIWYRRELTVVKAVGKRALLHFEAVDYQSTVWINDTQVGSNIGGNLPFSFDITDALKDGINHITLKVIDATNSPGAYQLHGKQVLKPGGIWYTPVSGIWQTVWMEQVPEKHIVAARITPSTSGKVVISLETTEGGEASVTASLKGVEVASASGPADALVLAIPQPELWSPESPTLYDLTIRFGDDVVKSYTGLRETTVIRDRNGHLRFALNGKEYFHWGTLDQGWWPDGLLTPPSEEAMIYDIRFLKQAGFNTIRKHIKVEPRRYYAHCDRIGMLVWQDQVSSHGPRVSPKWTRLDPEPADAEWPDHAHRQFMAELKLMIDTLHNHPSIIQWVAFNESWGQHRTEDTGKWIMDHDPSRQLNIASGGNFFPVGHIVDHHQYPHPGFPFELGANGRLDGFVKVIGEFGGHGFPVDGHLWDPKAKNWGYGGLPKDKDEWVERFKTSIRMLAEFRRKGIAGGIYTQTTDVEPEINGLLTYDRKVRKIGAAALARILKESGLMD